MKRNLTSEQLAARDSRRAQFRNLCKQIAAMTPEARLAFAAKFPGIVTVDEHGLSPYNTCLVLMQSGGRATVVGGFRQWIKAGRAVTKGQHGFGIWVPIGQKASNDDTPASEDGAEGEGENRPGFIMGTVFDVSQTQEIETETAPAISENLATTIPELQVA